MSDGARVLSIDALRVLATEALAASRTSPANAACVAEALVAADADGIASHGVSRVPFYADQAISGKVDGHAELRRSWPRPGVVAVDARHWIFPGELVRESMLRIEESRCCGSPIRPAAEFSLQ